jgi:hypothetical protein
MFILDTKTGDAWTWDSIVGTDASTAGSIIRYEGHVVPGNYPGDIVVQQGFREPPKQRPGK